MPVISCRFWIRSIRLICHLPACASVLLHAAGEHRSPTGKACRTTRQQIRTRSRGQIHARPSLLRRCADGFAALPPAEMCSCAVLAGQLHGLMLSSHVECFGLRGRLASLPCARKEMMLESGGLTSKGMAIIIYDGAFARL